MRLRKFALIHLILVLIFVGIGLAVFFGTGGDFDNMGMMVPIMFMIFLTLATVINFLVFLPSKIITGRIMSRGIQTTATAVGVVDKGYSRGQQGEMPTHNGFAVRLTYLDVNGAKVEAISRTRYADRSTANDLVRLKKFQIKYLGKRVEILPCALNAFYEKNPNKRPKRFGFERIGEYQKSREQIERDKRRKEELSKLTRKERRQEYLKDYGVTTKFVYWIGIIYAVTVVGAMALTVYFFMSGQELFGGIAFGGMFIWAIVGGMLYMKLKDKQADKVSKDPMARETNGTIEEVTFAGDVMGTSSWSVRVAVGDKKPIAIIKNDKKINVESIVQEVMDGTELKDEEQLLIVDGKMLQVGDRVRVMFNPKNPNICKIVRKVTKEEQQTLDEFNI